VLFESQSSVEMRILHHDFGGYPYPAELSRVLARRGHVVMHSWCSSLETTPGGDFSLTKEDPQTLVFQPIDLREPLNKYGYIRRWLQEREYGRLASVLTERFRPDVILCANVPLDPQARLLKTATDLESGFVYWLQDFVGIATYEVLRRRFPLVGHAIGIRYKRLEARLLREADAIVPITDEFFAILSRYGVGRNRITLIENWAPLADLPVRRKDNEWARRLQIADRFVFLYAGSMGMKHDPQLLVVLAEAVDHLGACVVVVSQGPGADYLARARQDRGLDNLILVDFEPFERMPDVMGSADVLVAVLEPEAARYSVPSKVLAYLCAKRPLLLAVPEANLAARIVEREGAGLVVAPGDVRAFRKAALRLFFDAEGRAAMANHARIYAQSTFDAEAIGDRFEEVLAVSAGVSQHHSGRSGRGGVERGARVARL
jgi:colanic acid biosynthesis glycosyl transferase WcaI